MRVAIITATTPTEFYNKLSAFIQPLTDELEFHYSTTATGDGQTGLVVIYSVLIIQK
jgi:hypothetical protein